MNAHDLFFTYTYADGRATNAALVSQARRTRHGKIVRRAAGPRGALDGVFEGVRPARSSAASDTRTRPATSADTHQYGTVLTARTLALISLQHGNDASRVPTQSLFSGLDGAYETRSPYAEPSPQEQLTSA
ncbi:hypothetical protein EVAR_99796_1 [Eumeta japonica]|uniref:Uncharacterized protein n=1 Tax=Eumeta variegata TaxID=151549 RepID=A0A4C1ZF14_EUMVA|nr:hypothetical protein EVAR_99796_1 [Eumeta japonica]